MGKSHAHWLPRRERPRDWTLERYLLAPSPNGGAQDAIAALEAELAEERARRAELERRLREQEARLAALRDGVASGRAEGAGAAAAERAVSDERPMSAAWTPRSARRIELRPRDEASGPAYWLRRCEGFRVESAAGFVGTVDGVRFDRRHDRPDAVVVATGRRWRRRLLVVPADQVEEIAPAERRIVLAGALPGAPLAAGPPGPRVPLVRAAVAGSLAVLLGAVALLVLLHRGGAGRRPARATSSAPRVETRPPPARRSARPVAVPVALHGAGAWDPGGDGREHDELAALATDGDPATAWRTETYAAGLRKPGVGLLLDAGSPVPLARLVVQTDTPGYTALVEAGGVRTGPFAAVSRAQRVASSTTFALTGRDARYYVVWITSLDRVAHVNEVRAFRFHAPAG